MANILVVVYRHVTAQLATLRRCVGRKIFTKTGSSKCYSTDAQSGRLKVHTIFTYLQLLQFHNILGPGARWLRWQSKGGEERHRASICLILIL